MAKTSIRQAARTRRKKHIRKSVVGTTARPRLSVFRSATHIYAQIINDENGSTLVSASTLSSELKSFDGNRGNKAAAGAVGTLLATKAKEAGIETVSFDRNGYLYHGRVKALADAAREGGLQF
jgi:large subunit ribosomal protein L18